MSTSTFTGSPTAATPSVVAASVCGINAIWISGPSSAATVRLTPSIATDPFWTTSSSSSPGIRTVRVAPPSASRRIAAIRPTPSTWPWTRWPPSRAARVTGRSRLTVPPARAEPSAVRSSVSPLRSNASVSSVRSTTVKHVPLTATDAPTGLSVATSGQATTSLPPSSRRTAPSSSTMPVNIRLHPYVGTDRVDTNERQVHRGVDRREPLPHDGARRMRPAHDPRRDVLHDPVDRGVTQEAPSERGPAFQEHALHVALSELLQERVRRDAAGRVGRTDRHLDARRKRARERRLAGHRRRHERRRVVVEAPCARRDCARGVHHHPQWRPRRRKLGMAGRERRVVRRDGARADDDRIRPRAQP